MNRHRCESAPSELPLRLVLTFPLRCATHPPLISSEVSGGLGIDREHVHSRRPVSPRSLDSPKLATQLVLRNAHGLYLSTSIALRDGNHLESCSQGAPGKGLSHLLCVLLLFRHRRRIPSDSRRQ